MGLIGECVWCDIVGIDKLFLIPPPPLTKTTALDLAETTGATANAVVLTAF